MMRIPTIFFTAMIVAGPALAVDDCLLGTWEADLGALSQIMGRQMNGTAIPVGGNVLMTITPDSMANMVIDRSCLECCRARCASDGCQCQWGQQRGFCR